MALTIIEKLRLSVADNEPGLPLLTDDEYQYFLEKNNNSVPRASLDAARTILLKLSQRDDTTVDIFSVKSKSAENYRLSLQMLLRDPNMNPFLQSTSAWFGGISKSEMQANVDNSDNNIVTNPYTENNQNLPTSYFEF